MKQVIKSFMQYLRVNHFKHYIKLHAIRCKITMYCLQYNFKGYKHPKVAKLYLRWDRWYFIHNI